MSAEAVQSTNTEFSSESVARWVKYASSAALMPLSRRVLMSLRSRPFLSMMKRRLLESPQIRSLRPVLAAIFSRFFAMMSTRALPTVPNPAMKRLMSFPLLRSKNSLWMVRMAASASSEDMITDMFLSEDPCAVALTGILLRPSAASIRPVAPVWLSTSSPTRHTMEKPFSTLRGLSLPREISYAKQRSAASRAFSASFSETAMHIVCTEEAWVIRIMLISFWLSVSKRRLEKPGIPTIPLPSRERRAILSELEMPMSLSLLRGGFFSISVPDASGSKVFLI